MTPWRSTSTVPSVVELRGQPLGEAALRRVGVVAVAAEERLPLVGLGRADEREQLGGVEAERRVEVRGLGLEVAAVFEQRCLDGVLEARAR